MIGNEEGPGGSPRQRVEHRLIRARRTPADPLESRRGTGTNHRPAAPGRNPYRRRRTTELSPPITHIHAERPYFMMCPDDDNREWDSRIPISGNAFRVW